MTLKSNPTLFYASNCPHCHTTIPAVAEHFATEGRQLIVRKPTLRELKSIPSVPALYIPENIYGTRPIMLVGSNLIVWLKTLKTQNYDHSSDPNE